MRFHIPFTFGSIDKIKQRAQLFSTVIKRKRKSALKDYLANADVPLSREEYYGIVIRTSITVFLAALLFFTTIFAVARISRFYLLSLGIAALFAFFVIMSQLLYPKLYSSRRERNIEKNLIPMLDDMMVQLNSGIPLFSILVNISASDYGELSDEMKKAVRKINTGMPQMEALDELGRRNSSGYFRRTLWQISNGMRAGSDITSIIRDSIHSLNEEQLLQMQNYGNKLNPLVMFYMLISVILPALSITFLTVISSLVNLPKTATIALFCSLFVFVIIIQVMFLGVMKSTKPSLL